MKVLIVDDEAQIRRWMEALLAKTGLELQVLGTCGNGAEALEFCRVHPVELVITDIRMPIMDGLELIRSLKEENIPVRTLILSSYDEFKYASEALKLGADDYILKAEVTSESLRETVNKAKSRMDAEKQRTNEVHQLKSRLNENQYAMRASYFNNLLRGDQAARRDFRRTMDLYRTKLADKHVMLMAVSLDDRSETAAPKIADPGLLEKAILNILDETIAKETGTGCAFAYQENLFVILCNAEGFGGKTVREKAIRDAFRLSDNLRDYLHVSASVGISEPHYDLSALPRQLKEALDALRQRRFYGKRNIVWASDTMPVLTSDIRKNMQNVAGEISGHIEMGAYKSAIQALTVFMAEDNRLKALPESHFKAFCLELIFAVLHTVRKIEQTTDQLDRYRSESLHEQLGILKTYEETKDWLLRTVSGLLGEVARLRPPYSEPVRSALRFLELYYPNDISLQQIAEYVHLNKTYLCELFKKETSLSINDYLTQIRIERAKELMAAGENRMGTLAEQVGYPNASYFTKVFKKMTGMTPVEYKKRK
ncbi:AraC family two component transcriptional regulator [Paenibacillus sp. BK033]|uniref:response regulator transcription factor n=1 Tax=Paenibacillus sp. BK033 TaxID=2512133 RepID=UPI0010484F1A|nr:response regulator [Paenibacillus sp. BK033]TCM89765.1 AraC family two component transcriptional regulator [Paenibacillus sp. BK033]